MGNFESSHQKQKVVKSDLNALKTGTVSLEIKMKKTEEYSNTFIDDIVIHYPCFQIKHLIDDNDVCKWDFAVSAAMCGERFDENFSVQRNKQDVVDDVVFVGQLKDIAIRYEEEMVPGILWGQSSYKKSTIIIELDDDDNTIYTIHMDAVPFRHVDNVTIQHVYGRTVKVFQ